MDGNQFDELSRTLASGVSRRSAIKGIAGGLLGALGLRTSADAQVTQVDCGNQFCASNPAVCNDGCCVCCVYTNAVTGQVINSRCRPPGTCTGTIVSPTTTTSTTTQEPTTTTTTVAPTTTTTTTAGPLVCPSGFADCDGNPANGCETNTNIDNLNCGGCNQFCFDGVCTGGVCVVTCEDGLLDCDGAGFCIDPQSNNQHCGTCEIACLGGAVCVSGQCIFN